MFLFVSLHTITISTLYYYSKTGKKIQSNRPCRHYALDVRNVQTADVAVTHNNHFVYSLLYILHMLLLYLLCTLYFIHLTMVQLYTTVYGYDNIVIDSSTLTTIT